jgi:hypothetical protein
MARRGVAGVVVVTTTYTTLLNWLDVIINVNKIYEAVHQELSGDFACLSVLRSLLTDSGWRHF